MKNNVSNTIHQVETFGATYEFDYLDEASKDTTYINVLNIDNTNEYLNKVLISKSSLLQMKTGQA